MKESSTLRAGDWVEVRSKEDILRSLDAEARLEGLPFMPEMLEFCGQRFRVYKRAHKTCDPPNGLCGRSMPRAVHLENVRCNGAAHGGCQARCLIFWKEAWLKPLDERRANAEIPAPEADHPRGCSEQNVHAKAQDRTAEASPDDPVYVCQSTHLSGATQPLRWWDPRHYLEDCISGNARVGELLAALLIFFFAQIESAGIGLGAVLRWFYDALQRMRGGTPYPLRTGKIPMGVRTPVMKLNLQPGELVKIRSYEEILGTVNEAGLNRGMLFDREMVPYCGGEYTVLDRVTKIINERTGKMRHLASDCIMLDGVICRARYSKYRRFCSRSIYPFWREAWLERAGNTAPCGSVAKNKTGNS